MALCSTHGDESLAPGYQVDHHLTLRLCVFAEALALEEEPCTLPKL
jgi:hypothetical protein